MGKYSSADWTDDILLDLIRLEDDRAAFAELYDRYWDLLADIVGKRVQTIETAEEIVQDVFVSLFIRRKEIKVQTTLEAYLKAALKFQVYKVYRAQKTHENYLNSVIHAQGIEPVRPDSLLEEKQLRERILQVSDKMPAKCREVFLLSRFEQLSNQDIADKLHISVAMVRKHITTAMKIMRTEFNDPQLNTMAVCFFIYFFKH